MAEFRRDCTVGEVRAMLADYSDHQPIAPLVNGVVGVLTAVRLHALDSGGPVLLIGEADLPPHLIESLREVSS